MLAEIYQRHVEMIAMMRRFAPLPPRRKRVSEAPDLQGNLFGEF